MGGLKKSDVKTTEDGKYYQNSDGTRTPIGDQAGTSMPPLAPSPTDEALRKRRSAAITRAGLGYGRKSTMLTSVMGEPTLQKSTLGGY